MTSINNELIHIAEWGPEKGRRVVMIHGSVQGSPMAGVEHFATQEKLAERGWRLIVPDRAGHADSPSQGHPDDVDIEGEWVAGLLGDGAHLIGHSFGAAIAFAAAGRRPEAVRSLTLIEPALAHMAMREPAVKAFVEKQIELLHSGRPMSEIAGEFTKLVGIPEEIMADTRGRRGSIGLGEALQAVRWAPPPSLMQYAKTIKNAGIPVMAVSGGWSPGFDATCKVVVEETGGVHRIFPSPHHFVNLYAPDFNDALHEFMTGADQRS